jgi:hypothetical protein
VNDNKKPKRPAVTKKSLADIANVNPIPRSKHDDLAEEQAVALEVIRLIKGASGHITIEDFKT